MATTYTTSVQETAINLARRQIEVETAAIFEAAIKKATEDATAKRQEIIANTMIDLFQHENPMTDGRTLTIEIRDNGGNHGK